MKFTRKHIRLLSAVAACTIVAPVRAQFVQQGSKLVATGGVGAMVGLGASVALSADGNTALVGGYYDNNLTGAAWVFIRSGGTWVQQGSKLVGTGAVGSASQGWSVALSADGNTALVGGFLDNNGVGGAWVWTRNDGVWTQQGSKLVGTGAVGPANQGNSVALSADGNTALVGGVEDNTFIGAAWVFTRSGGIWTQQGSKLVGTGAVGSALQGISVALSADGNTALVGGAYDNSSAGAAWVFTRSGGIWTQQGSKLSGTGAVGSALQGISVALSADGYTAVLGGLFDNNRFGAAWVFARSGGIWSQQGPKLVGTGAAGSANQGWSVALSGDGNTALVGGDADNNGLGAAWVWTRGAGTWAQQGSKLVGTGAVGAIVHQGQSVALSADGNTALVGGPNDNNTAGAVWAYSLSLQFVPVPPCRIADTRYGIGPFGGPAIAGGASRDFFVPDSACGIPPAAQAYSLNITVVPHGHLEYLTVWPSGQTRPVASTLNSLDGRTVANAAFVRAGAGGAISIYVSDTTDVFFDINGYFVPPGAPGGLQFYRLTPCRVADTRSFTGPPGPLGPPSMSARSTRSFPVLSSGCSIPASAVAYSLNVSAVPTTSYLGYLTAWGTGQPQPIASTLNSWTGTIAANAAIVTAGTGGAISVYVSDATDVFFDINGYFAPPGAGGLQYHPVTQCRIADTRSFTGPPGLLGPPSMSAQSTRSFPVLSSACGIPATAAAYALNVTAAPIAGYLQYLTTWATGQPQPSTSTLNSWTGATVANAALVPAGAAGAISIYVSDATDVFFDINGYFAP